MEPAPQFDSRQLTLAVTGMAILNGLLWIWLFWAASLLVGAQPSEATYTAVAAVATLAVPVGCRAVTGAH